MLLFYQPEADQPLAGELGFVTFSIAKMGEFG